jgi:hypothetical protein
MKRFILIVIVIFLAVIAVFAFRRPDTSITGRINPVDGANVAWAIGGKDSSTSNIVNGSFNLVIKPGMYKVVINANEPYKDAILENISVKDGQTIDVGEIVLQKK